MSDSSIVLLVVFVVIVVVSWLLINLGATGFGVYQKTFTSTAESNLEKMFLFFDYKKMFFANMIFIVLIPLAIYGFSKSIFYAALSLIAIIFMPKVMLVVMAKRRKQAIVEALPDGLAQIAGSMRSGSTFSSSIENMVNETSGPISQEFALLLKEQKMGISQQDALENLGERIDSEDVDLVVTAALIARDVGGNLAETLERLSNMLRKKIEMEGKIKALTSQGKMQGWVVGALPFAIILALTYVEPESIGPIFSTYLGWGFLAVILLLEFMGAIMIRKIVSIDV